MVFFSCEIESLGLWFGLVVKNVLVSNFLKHLLVKLLGIYNSIHGTSTIYNCIHGTTTVDDLLNPLVVVFTVFSIERN